MSKRELKAALESLQVSKPLRVQALSFTAPPVAVRPSPGTNASRDQTESQDMPVSVDVEAPRDNKPPQDAVASLDSESSPDQIQSEDTNQSRDKNISLDTAVSQVVNRCSQPRRATPQDAAVLEVESAAKRLGHGYTRLPNSLLMRMVEGDLSRNEIKLLLFIARMTISFSRDLVPLSKSVIERMTGIQGRVVLQALQNLERLGLVRKIAGDHFRPSQLGLVLEAGWDQPKKTTQGKFQSQDRTTPSDQNRPPDTSKPQGGFPTQGSDQSHKKDSIRNIKTLSHLPEKLQNYFARVMPTRKRESEYEALEGLLRDFTPEQIADCVDRVERLGIPGTGDPCHSPLAFLAHAMTRVIAEVSAEKTRLARELEHARASAHAELEKQKQEAREAEEFRRKEQAFDHAFSSSDRQREVIGELIRKLPLKPPQAVARSLAIEMWWDSLCRSERQEFTD